MTVSRTQALAETAQPELRVGLFGVVLLLHVVVVVVELVLAEVAHILQVAGGVFGVGHRVLLVSFLAVFLGVPVGPASGTVPLEVVVISGRDSGTGRQGQGYFAVNVLVQRLLGQEGGICHGDLVQRGPLGVCLALDVIPV